MAETKKVGGVQYEQVDATYFEERSLRRHAGVWSLWALGVGAVISGDFFGWNYGLGAGGFGGLLIATVIVTIMYIGLCFSLAEMSPALPHTGGAYSFARTTMGPWGGILTGLGENMEYVLTPAVIVVSVGAYLTSVFGTPVEFVPVWWLITYVIFVGLNIWGVELSFRFTLIITFISLTILAVFFVGALGVMDYQTHALNIPPEPGGTPFLPFGTGGILKAIPFAIWFLLAIEQLPLAAEESHDPKRDMPRGILLGLLTLVILAFTTLLLNSSVAPGAEGVGKSEEPLFLGFKAIYGEGMGTKILALIAVAGLIASFHAIVYAYGRNIYSLSRAGYFPRWLSVTSKSRQTPHVALISGGVLGLVTALLMKYSGSKLVGAALLNMAVFGAVISYVMQMLSFILLRSRFPNIDRPYRSPVGTAGAAVAMVIAIVALAALFMNPDYRPGVYGAAIWYVAGVAYFAVVGRNKLVLAPEEQFALNHTLKKDEAPAKAEGAGADG